MPPGTPVQIHHSNQQIQLSLGFSHSAIALALAVYFWQHPSLTVECYGNLPELSESNPTVLAANQL